MNTELQSIVSRIHKLMALTTERGASEQEAALAAEHVQRLLTEHNLSMAMVEAAGGDAGSDAKREKSKFSRKQVYKWQRVLMKAIGELNFCHVSERYQYQQRGPSIFDGYEVVGRVSNVAATTHTFDYLVQTIERLAREEAGDPSQYFTRKAHSFKEGCSDRLVSRLRDKRREIELENERKTREEAARRSHPSYTPSNALVVSLADVIQNEEDLNNDMRFGYPPGTTAKRRAEGEAKQAEADAKRAARKAELVAQGVAENVADMMARGWSRERAEEICNPEPVKPETEAQRRKREAREERRDQRWRDQWRRERDRESRRLDRDAYDKGREAGQTIGLDPQVRKGSNVRGIK